MTRIISLLTFFFNRKNSKQQLEDALNATSNFD